MDSSTVSANTADSHGGGIINNGTLNITFSTIGGVNGGNQANQGGGGIYNGHVGTVTLDSSTVSANTDNAAGGGIYNVNSLNIQNGSVIGEAGLQNSAGYGGGIYNIGTTTVHGSTVSANQASSFGDYRAGASHHRGSSPTSCRDCPLPRRVWSRLPPNGPGAFPRSAIRCSPLCRRKQS